MVVIASLEHAQGLCRETSRVPASVRQSQNVPVSYPRRIKISPSRATQYAHLQGFLPSPLTDSNRRPPPYHFGVAATGGNPQQRILLVFAASALGRFAIGCHWLRLLGSINAPSVGPESLAWEARDSPSSHGRD